MPDITMCKGGNCPHKEKCYRFTAKPSYYQSYFVEPPIGHNGKCDSYWGENGKDVWNEEDEIVKEKQSKFSYYIYLNKK